MIRQSIQKQTGFSAITAIVMVVLLALMGAYMSTFVSVSALNTSSSEGAIKAWFAARSGVQWAVHRVLSTGTCVNVNGQAITAGLDGFTASISCVETAAITEGSATYDIFDIDVTATRGAIETFVSRTINVTVTDNSAP